MKKRGHHFRSKEERRFARFYKVSTNWQRNALPRGKGRKLLQLIKRRINNNNRKGRERDSRFRKKHLFPLFNGSKKKGGKGKVVSKLFKERESRVASRKGGERTVAAVEIIMFTRKGSESGGLEKKKEGGDFGAGDSWGADGEKRLPGIARKKRKEREREKIVLGKRGYDFFRRLATARSGCFPLLISGGEAGRWRGVSWTESHSQKKEGNLAR